MARNVAHIGAPPDAIWEVLADPDSYGHWVVGSSDIRDAEPGFPAAGTRFHHRIGFGPLKVADHTEVLESSPPHLLKLKAKARPLGTALVTLAIEPDGEGSRVTMTEDPGDAISSILFNPLAHLLVRLRNVESLGRLRELAEAQAGTRAR